MKFLGIRSGNKLAHDVAVGPAADANDSDHAGEKKVTSTEFSTLADSRDETQSIEAKPAEDVQEGVKKIEAVTLTWTKHELIFAYAW
jgi:hypothetical protein